MTRRLTPEFEFVDSVSESVRYLEHGWPTELCRWHSHQAFELHLITATRGKAFIGEHIGEFAPGALYLVGPNVPHNWVTDAVGDCGPVALRDMLVQFGGESLDAMKLAFPEFREFDDLMERAHGGLEFPDFNLSNAMMHFAGIRDASGAERVLRFLTFLSAVRAHPRQRQLSHQNRAFPEREARISSIAEVVDHVTTHFAEPITLKHAAERAHMSATAFSRNFRKYTGTGFSEFVTKVRIGQACSMLQATDEKVATICHEVGFRNLANFNRHFLKVKDMTPSTYRHLTRSELSPDRDAHGNASD